MWRNLTHNLVNAVAPPAEDHDDNDDEYYEESGDEEINSTDGMMEDDDSHHHHRSGLGFVSMLTRALDHADETDDDDEQEEDVDFYPESNSNALPPNHIDKDSQIDADHEEMATQTRNDRNLPEDFLHQHDEEHVHAGHQQRTDEIEHVIDDAAPELHNNSSRDDVVIDNGTARQPDDGTMTTGNTAQRPPRRESGTLSPSRRSEKKLVAPELPDAMPMPLPDEDRQFGKIDYYAEMMRQQHAPLLTDEENVTAVNDDSNRQTMTKAPHESVAINKVDPSPHVPTENASQPVIASAAAPTTNPHTAAANNKSKSNIGDVKNTKLQRPPPRRGRRRSTSSESAADDAAPPPAHSAAAATAAVNSSSHLLTTISVARSPSQDSLLGKVPPPSAMNDDDSQPLLAQDAAAAAAAAQTAVPPQPAMLQRSVPEGSSRPHVAAKTAEVVGAQAAKSSPPQREKTVSRTDLGRSHNGDPAATTTAESADPLPQREQALTRQCTSLQTQLAAAEQRIRELQQQMSNATTAAEQRDELHRRFQEKEARLLQQADEEREHEIRQVRSSMETQMNELRREIKVQRKTHEQEVATLRRQLQESARLLEVAEQGREDAEQRQTKTTNQQIKQLERERHLAEDKLVAALANLDEREEEVRKLRSKLQSVQSEMSEHQHGAHEAEEELDELHHENEALRHHVERVDQQLVELRAKVTDYDAVADKLSQVKMELRLAQEELEQERATHHTTAASAETSTAQIMADRHAARAELADVQRQLAAMQADLELAQTDTERVMQANNNLQIALEAFQGEREAELTMLNEQRHEAEHATAAAHAAALAATHEAHEARVRELQHEHVAAARVTQDLVTALTDKLEKYRVENVQMRRSLDEAINRLQSTQEDVIDRAFMKNILLDWLTKTGVKERQDVLELMASVLHFSDDEKSRVHVGTKSLSFGGLGTLPPAKADLEHLEGDNVREKWINFLLAETDE